MSCGNPHETPCVEVLASIVFIADGESDFVPHLEEIEIHLGECPPCQAELEHERAMALLVKDSLRRSCNEKAPEDLHQVLSSMLNSSLNSPNMVASFSMSEVSIEIDEFGNVQTHEIHIEHTQEYRIHEDE